MAVSIGSLAVAGVSPAGAAVGGGPAWSAPTVFPGSFNFTSISCTSASECTVAGTSSIPGSGFAVATETGGVWGTPTALAGPAGVQFPAFNSISCTSVGNCTAVGQGWTVATETGGVWSAVTKLPVGSGNFYSVSCTSPGNCTAAGGGFTPVVATETNGVWATAIHVAVRSSSGPLDSTGDFNAISCTSADNCTAAGVLVSAGASPNEPIVVDETNGVWGAPTVLTWDNGSIGSISCTSPGNCTLVGAYSLHGLVATETGGVWSAVTSLPSSVYDGLYSVSCTSAGNCTAVGSGGYPEFATESGGNWDTPTAALTGSGAFYGVSCPSAGTCTAVGFGSGGSIVSSFPGPFAIVAITPPSASLGVIYSPVALAYANDSLSAPTFTTKFKWKATGLPKGMKLNATTGVLGGKPGVHDAPGVYPVTVSLTETVTTLNGSKKVKTPTTATITLSLTVS